METSSRRELLSTVRRSVDELVGAEPELVQVAAASLYASFGPLALRQRHARGMVSTGLRCHLTVCLMVALEWFERYPPSFDTYMAEDARFAAVRLLLLAWLTIDPDTAASKHRITPFQHAEFARQGLAIPGSEPHPAEYSTDLPVAASLVNQAVEILAVDRAALVPLSQTAAMILEILVDMPPHRAMTATMIAKELSRKEVHLDDGTVRGRYVAELREKGYPVLNEPRVGYFVRGDSQFFAKINGCAADA